MEQLRQRARQLRNGATDAECQLWRFLRGRQLDGFRFRRQVPIAGYIVDFICPELKLVVELDGGQHVDSFAYDSERTQVLVTRGYRVLRYWNDDVLLRIDDVLADILRHVQSTPPQPSPALRAREGAEGESRK